MAKRLGRGIPDAAWDFLVEDHYVAEALSREYPDSEDRLFGRLEQLLRLVGQIHSAPAQGTVEPAALAPRIEAVSRLAAESAGGRSEVLDFRRRVLERESPMSRDEAEAYLDTDEARAPHHGKAKETLELLKYQNGHIAYDLHVWAGSPLDELRQLAEQLALVYPWQPEQAASFVLEA